MRVADDAGRALEFARDRAAFAVGQRVERQKRRAPQFVNVEKFDRALGVLGLGGDDV